MSDDIWEDPKDRLLEFCKEHFNEICIVGFGGIYRLIGFAITDEDYYYIIKTIHGGKEYHSCVGAIESLKGKIEHYEGTDETFTLNNSSPERELIIEFQDKDIETSKYDLLSEKGLEGEWNKEEEAKKWIRIKGIIYE